MYNCVNQYIYFRPCVHQSNTNVLLLKQISSRSSVNHTIGMHVYPNLLTGLLTYVYKPVVNRMHKVNHAIQPSIQYTRQSIESEYLIPLISLYSYPTLL